MEIDGHFASCDNNRSIFCFLPCLFPPPPPKKKIVVQLIATPFQYACLLSCIVAELYFAVWCTQGTNVNQPSIHPSAKVIRNLCAIPIYTYHNFYLLLISTSTVSLRESCSSYFMSVNLATLSSEQWASVQLDLSTVPNAYRLVRMPVQWFAIVSCHLP